MYLKRTTYYLFITRLFNKHQEKCVCTKCGAKVIAVPYVDLVRRLKISRRQVDRYRKDGDIPTHTVFSPNHKDKIMYTRTQATLIAALVRAYRDAGTKWRGNYPYKYTIKRVKLRMQRKWFKECNCTLETENENK